MPLQGKYAIFIKASGNANPDDYSPLKESKVHRLKRDLELSRRFSASTVYRNFEIPLDGILIQKFTRDTIQHESRDYRLISARKI